MCQHHYGTGHSSSLSMLGLTSIVLRDNVGDGSNLLIR